ncbi:IclR family transcriptional regulator [Acidovorax sp. JHL-9]|uniref:IclR family transcriptional regulator n=1 Tax=Acidovorax sp. JHL-9 TaxID=1276756 RepID=UPI00041835DC|nr:IclR family transcriptional regulator [Acidovorax sp. JHL-9]
MTESTTAPPPANTAESSGIAVLDKAFSLLAAFGPDDGRLTLTELSRRTGLYKSTALRLLGALEHGGFIRKLPDGQYSMGPQPLRLASIYQRSFQVGHVIEPLLKQLSAATGETASFYVRQDDKRIALFRAEPARSVRASVQIGQEYAVAQGASGKVLLAFSASPPRGYEGIREQLWAVSYGERDPETASAAAPVFGVNGELQGALTVSGPRARLEPSDAMLAACRQVLETARDATSALGGSTARYQQGLEQLTMERWKDRVA